MKQKTGIENILFMWAVACRKKQQRMVNIEQVLCISYRHLTDLVKLAAVPPKRKIAVSDSNR